MGPMARRLARYAKLPRLQPLSAAKAWRWAWARNSPESRKQAQRLKRLEQDPQRQAWPRDPDKTGGCQEPRSTEGVLRSAVAGIPERVLPWLFSRLPGARRV